MKNDVQYLTQEELSTRWKTSPSTIKNWRDRGKLPYFRVPGSSRVLYPLDGIVDVESQHTITVKDIRSKSRKAELNRKKSVVSNKPDKDWRI